ncbi:MAG TPA: ribose-phosphate diphosphokinase [Candidatus Binatus sp.]|jgi:ribose-phosphate pyrophosphokinase|nr:ribose-phosphate diphosphokinase [Candidatus Binatus sp.]
MIVLGGSGSTDLAGKVAKESSAKHGEVEIKRFPDGEKYVRIIDDVKGQNVAIVQSLYRNPDEYIMELLLLVDALRDLGAESITAIAPYLAYARQDSRFKPGEAVSSLTIAKLFEAVGINAFMTIDTHLHRLEDVSKVFHVPAYNLSAMPLLGKYALENLSPKKPVVVGPDEEAKPWAAAVAKELDAEHTVFRKKRVTSTKVEIDTGDIDFEGRDVVFADDIISTGGTIAESARACVKNGAKRVFALCTHPVLAEGALERLREAGVRQVVGTDTIPSTVSKVSVAPVIAEGLKRYGSK